MDEEKEIIKLESIIEDMGKQISDFNNQIDDFIEKQKETQSFLEDIKYYAEEALK